MADTNPQYRVGQRVKARLAPHLPDIYEGEIVQIKDFSSTRYPIMVLFGPEVPEEMKNDGVTTFTSDGYRLDRFRDDMGADFKLCIVAEPISEYEVGQRVRARLNEDSPRFYEGTIVSVRGDSVTYPILVNFDKIGMMSYTSDGFRRTSHRKLGDDFKLAPALDWVQRILSL